mmetsp:Transcript_162656/g.521513  ORF Transcript_162656/g.521513 Transcript_162656/m.521513 type:complete len:408 (+) Transcript_162656:461-1684(+)
MQPAWEQLSQRVVCVLGQNPSDYTLNGTNCYLVGSGPRRLLIDAGEKFYGGARFMENLERCMEEHGVEGLSGILITHMHFDHYGNIDRLQKKYGLVPVYTHDTTPEDQFALLREIRTRGVEHHFLSEVGEPVFNPQVGEALPPAPLPEGLDLTWADVMVRQFPGSSVADKVRYLFFYQWHGSDLMDKLRGGDYEWKPLRDGDVIRTDGATLVALHTPGHSQDHVSFLLEEEHSLFSGDHVLGWGTTLVFDMRDYMETLRRMLALKPIRLYPGHGAMIEDGVDLLTRYMEHRERREEQAWAALQRRDAPASVQDIARELYPDLPQERMWMARDNVEKLLRKFAGDQSAIAFSSAPGAFSSAQGGAQLSAYDLPESYSARRLPEGVLWAARRSMSAANLGGNRQQTSKL